ncbi:MAG: VOC family protein [Anaerolineales bacterium]|nr:VOC family protein [Anaerolineales bacterium]
MQKYTPFLMFVREQHGKAEEAMQFYAAVFAKAEIANLERFGAGEMESEGTLRNGVLRLGGLDYIFMDSSLDHRFTFTPAFSIFVQCESETEIESVFARLTEAGHILMPLDSYGFSRQFAWVQDKYDVSWQINLA